MNLIQINNKYSLKQSIETFKINNEQIRVIEFQEVKLYKL